MQKTRKRKYTEVACREYPYIDLGSAMIYTGGVGSIFIDIKQRQEFNDDLQRLVTAVSCALTPDAEDSILRCCEEVDAATAVPDNICPGPERDETCLSVLMRNPFVQDYHGVRVNLDCLTQTEIYKVLDDLNAVSSDIFQKSWLWIIKEWYEKCFDTYSFIDIKLFPGVVTAYRRTVLGEEQNIWPVPHYEKIIQMVMSEGLLMTSFDFPPKCIHSVYIVEVTTDGGTKVYDDYHEFTLDSDPDSTSFFQFDDTTWNERYLALQCRKVLDNPGRNTRVIEYGERDIQSLSGSQKTALDFVSRNRCTIINGRAGTGKTFLLSRLTSWLASRGEKYFCLSSYHRTVSRMAECGIERASTCHSWRKQRELQGIISSSESSHTGRHWCVSCGVRVLIVDEVGIADTHTLASVFAWLWEDDCHRVVFAGDVNQLPPIQGGSPISSILTLLEFCVVTLDRVHRVDTRCSPLLRLSERVLNGDDTINLEDQCVHMITISRYPDFHDASNMSEKEFLFPDFVFGESVVITNANREADAFNAYISGYHKQKLGYLGTSKLFEGATVYLCTGDKKGSLGEIVSCLDVKCVQVFNIRLSCGKVVSGLHEEDLMLGYAITLHKAQGSEFRRVYVDIGSVSFKKYARREWVYTAVTRAKQSVTFITTESMGMQGYIKSVSRESDKEESTLILRYFSESSKQM